MPRGGESSSAIAIAFVFFFFFVVVVVVVVVGDAASECLICAHSHFRHAESSQCPNRSVGGAAVSMGLGLRSLPDLYPER